jgi:RNA polymerase sigma-70 factor (ECF subfamily)
MAEGRPGLTTAAADGQARRNGMPQQQQQPPQFDFAAEYQKAYRVLWVVAAGVLGRSAGAEDVVQEAAVLALGKIGQFEPGTHFAAWMAQMVRFVALNHLRKQTRTQAAPLDENDPQARSPQGRPGSRRPGDAPLHLGSHGELPPGQQSFDDELTGALAALGETARACLLLRTLEELDYEEIGRVLGIPEGTAMSHVHRSRMRLRERLTRGRGERPSR